MSKFEPGDRVIAKNSGSRGTVGESKHFVGMTFVHHDSGQDVYYLDRYDLLAYEDEFLGWVKDIQKAKK